MSKVVLDVSVSLDGFTAGPNVRPAEPMGDGGEFLHSWMSGTESADESANEVDRTIRGEVDDSVGAVIIGRRTFDLGLEPWGGTPWPGKASFVVTHRARPDLVGDNGGTFAFTGLREAVARARAAAGAKDVVVLGSEVARALLRANLLDEVHLHVAPFLLGSGTRLFAGEQAVLVPARAPRGGSANHLRYRVAPRPGPAGWTMAG